MDTRFSFSSAKGTLFGLLGVLIFCALLSATVVAGEKKEKAATADEVSREISEAYAAMKSYGFAKKEEFLKWAENRNEVLQAQIDALDQKMEGSGEQLQEKLKETRNDLREERDRLAEKMKAVRESSEQAWEDAKWGVSAALEKLERAYERAKSRFEQDAGKKREPRPGE